MSQQARIARGRVGKGCGAALVLACAAAALAGPAYTETVIPPIEGGTGTIGYGVNDAGVVVGQADNAWGLLVGFVHIGGQTVELPLLPGGSDAKAVSINNSNVIVGECRDASNISRAVKWELVNDQWEITDLGTLAAGDAGFGVATRINDAGAIVGYTTASIPGGYHATLWSGGTKTDLGTLHYMGNNAFSQALGINEAGEVVGFAYATLQGPEHGMYVGGRGAEDITPAASFALAQWHNINESGLMAGYIAASNMTSGAFRPATYERISGTYTLIPTLPDAEEGYGYDINNDGTVVGVMFALSVDPEESIFKGFAWVDGQTVDLSAIVEIGTFVEARDVSNTGMIVGTADTATGPVAVLLTPAGGTCPADFNDDGGVTVQDIFDYLAAYFANGEGADFNGDRNVSVQDIFDFLAAYFAGC